jgi:hypothetical protein
MRAVWWLAIAFVFSIAVLFGGCAAAGFVTGANHLFEGLLGIAVLLGIIGAASSGMLILIIGPKAIKR